MIKFIITFIICSFFSFKVLAQVDNTAIKIINIFEGQQNIYEQIVNSLNHEYEQIGRISAKNAIDNKWVFVGGLNSLGISYHKAYLDFNININRTVAPDLFSDKWVVTDILTIRIDASKVLNRLKNENQIDISQKNLAAFAGVEFERKFTWFHLSNTYEDGMSLNFEKLFFPFLSFNVEKIQKLSKEEFLIREDSLSFNAGAIGTVPIVQGTTLMAGALTKFEKISKIEITKKFDEISGDDVVLISLEKSKNKLVGASIDLQIQFLNILKMSLLSYDFNYELDKSYKIYTKIKKSDFNEFSNHNEVGIELNKILKEKEADTSVIAPYIISEENKISEILTHKYNILLMGGVKEAQTTQINVVNKGYLNSFFKHNFDKTSYTENVVSKLFTSFLYAVFNAEMKAAYETSDSKKLSIEYRSNKNLLDAKEDINVENQDSQKLSISISSEFNTTKISGLNGKKNLEKTKVYIEKYSSVNNSLLKFIDDGAIKTPIQINGKFEIDLKGIKYFNEIDINTAFDSFDGICNDRPKNLFFKFLSMFDSCKSNLSNNYVNYLQDLSHDKITADKIQYCEDQSKKIIFNPGKKRSYIKSCLKEITYIKEGNWVNIPLFTFRNIAQDLANSNYNKEFFYLLFGKENVFFHGHFKSKTSSGNDFITYFHDGNFNGLGVIDNYMRKENMRSPTSIVSE